MKDDKLGVQLRKKTFDMTSLADWFDRYTLSQDLILID